MQLRNWQSLSRIMCITVLLIGPVVALAVTKQTLHSFSSQPNGADPFSPLVRDSAGNFFGVASGGAYGVIFKLTRGKSGAWTETVIHNFTGGLTDGSAPIGELVIDGKGNLYGVTLGGGTYDGGTVFQFTPSTAGWKETLLHSFVQSYGDGYRPEGLVMDAAGNLYGTTEYGGNSHCANYKGQWVGCGTVFEMTPQANGTWSETILYNFGVTSTATFPASALVIDKAGNLYGTTSSGGSGNCYYTCGVWFELSKGSNGVWTEIEPYAFQGTTSSGVTLDSSGNVYAFDGGTVLQFISSNSSWIENILYTFATGLYPSGVPVFDSAGHLYAVTGYAYNSPAPDGTIFELSPTSSGNWNEATLYTFTGGSDGAYPNTPMLDSAGNIYVAATQGGLTTCPTFYPYYAAQCGTIFELSPGKSGGWSGTTLFEFAPGAVDGSTPMSGLVADSAGNLYGTASGGAAGQGVVYRVTPNSNGKWTSTVLYSFTGTTYGAGPNGLVLDSSGNLYGTTQWGGQYGTGTVYKLSPSTQNSWTETTLYSFVSGSKSTDGYDPNSAVIFDSQGNLYGSTTYGGAYGCGSIFKLAPSSGGTWTETIIYSFAGCQGVYFGTTGLIFDQHGNLYGTNQLNSGIVFELSPPSGSGTQWTEKTLYSFAGGSDGRNPLGGVVFDAAGNLYGTVWAGGVYDGGEVYKLAPNSGGTWTKTALHSFTGVNGDGSSPKAGLVIDSNGNLYGTTSYGGTSGCNFCGSVFELQPSGSGYRETILHSFTLGVDGSAPYAPLIRDSLGNLYGTTSNGGTGAQGTVFEIKP